jgi:FSR family fosmidomycin resistance protein-like MFS transporter
MSDVSDKIKKADVQDEMGISFKVLVALGVTHCLNDCLQSIVSATYPILKQDLALTFQQIGLVTLIYQLAASVFQPVIGYIFDKRPSVWSLPMGMTFTLCGLVSLAFADTLPWVMASVFLHGLGSSTFHPEASRLTSLASGGRRGLAQSLFQIGGNFGSSMGPLLVALIVAPYTRHNLGFFAVLALVAIIVMLNISRWYKQRLKIIVNQRAASSANRKSPFPLGITVYSIIILMFLIFSKYIYLASLTNYYTFYLIEKFDVSVQQSQIMLFVFLIATAIGTMIGGPLGDKIGRKYVIWISILGAAPFALAMPHLNLFWTGVMSFCTGLMLSSAFPAILVYAQELLPYKLGLVSGLFFGFAFGVAGIAAAILGKMADMHGIEAVYNVCAYMPLLGLITCFLPDVRKARNNLVNS